MIKLQTNKNLSTADLELIEANSLYGYSTTLK